MLAIILFNFGGLFWSSESSGNLSGILKLFYSGGVAQLGEHLSCTQGVRSSILLISTKRVEVGGAGYGLIAQMVRAHA